MTGSRRADLIYGHLGEAVYDSTAQEWHFARRPGICISPDYLKGYLLIIADQKFEPIARSTTCVESPIQRSTKPETHSADVRRQSIKDLIHLYPELVPGTSLLSPLVQASENVNEVTSDHDPSISELLDFGKAVKTDDKSWDPRTQPIAAVAGGVAGEAVRLIQIHKAQAWWQGHRSVRLDTIGLQNREYGWWQGNGGPVLQLCFAKRKGESSAWLAVRCHGSTTILYPLMHRLPAPASSLRSEYVAKAYYSSSRLEANPIANLPIQRSGGAPHIDVSFNPWYQQQFAVLDQQGHWSIWDIESKDKGRNSWTLTAGVSGHILDQYTQGPEMVNVEADGWGAILFVGSVSTLVVVGRRILSIFHLKSKPERLVAPELIVAKSSDWILDVKRSPIDDRHMFVVTSSCIFWLQIQSSEDMHDEKASRSGTSILLSWKHFRHQEDISLRLHIVYSTQDSTTVILYSRLTKLTTGFTFGFSSSSEYLPLSVSDPYLISLVDNAGSTSNPIDSNLAIRQTSSISALVLSAVKYSFQDGSLSGPGEMFMERGVQFYQLFTLHNDLSIRECLYAKFSSKSVLEICPPSHRNISAATPMRIKDEDFITPDGIALDDAEDTTLKSNRYRRYQNLRPLRKEPRPEDESWTLNFEWLKTAIQSRLQILPTSTSFNTCLNTIRLRVKESAYSAKPTVESLFEMLPTEISLEDIDSASADLQSLVESTTHSYIDGIDGDKESSDIWAEISALTAERLFQVTDENQEGEGHLLLVEIYDDLIRAWITSLPLEVPGRVRAAQEKSVRRIATELCLASHLLRLRSAPGPKEQKPEVDDTMHPQDFTLPVRRKAPSQEISRKGKDKGANLSSSPPVSSQISEDTSFMATGFSPRISLPTPDRTPSLHSRSSVSSSLVSEDPACKRLKEFSNFTSQASLPITMVNTLNHWVEGINPADYNWEFTKRSLTLASDTEGAGDESQFKRRISKKKELKRQRVNTVGTSSQPTPTRPWASQPQMTSIPPESSQLTELSGHLSQVEPGVYGGKSISKKKPKKKKRPGFR